MKKINIGVLNDSCWANFLKLLPLGDDFKFVLYSAKKLSQSCYDNITVGDNDCDIDLNTNESDSVQEYIVSICDIVIDSDFCTFSASITENNSALYVVNDTGYLNLKQIELSKEFIAKYIESLYDFKQDLPECKEPFWKNVYFKFFSKYKKKLKTPTYNEDFDTSSAVYKEFEKYDNKANRYNSIYRSSLYLRGLLPIFSTLLLAIALNISTMGKYIFSGEYWGLVSGVFFLAQALFNYLIIALSNYVSKNFIIENFMRARYMAESLRLVMISAPNALPRGSVSRILFTDIDGSIAAEGKKVKSIYKENLASNYRFNDANVVKIATNLRAISGNQLGYHTSNAGNCKRAADNLNMLAKIMFWVAMGVVIGRAIYQTVVQFVDISGQVNGVTTHNFLLVSLNFAATLIPSFTAMYTGLKTSLNIDNNYARSQIMQGLLSQYNDAIDIAMEKGMNYKLLNRFYDRLSKILMEETLDWHTATGQKKVSKI